MSLRQAQIPPLAGQPSYEIPEGDLLGVSDEMSAFVERYASGDYRNGGRAWSLAYAALDRNLLHFDYDPLVTLSASEAFAARRGNCLTFSSMFIAMARQAGLDAWYQEVKVPPEWSSVNDTMLVTMHVNAVVREKGAHYTVDISRMKKTSNAKTRRMSDREAQAQFYNNLGADALVESDLARAYAYFRRSIRTHPGLAYTWSNLGVVLKRNGQVEDALAVYEAALRLDSRQSVALNNLYIIHTEQGNLRAAGEVKAKVERNRRRNPYYLLHLARLASEEQRHGDAIELLQRAVRLKGADYRLHLALAQSLYRSGRGDLAQDSLRRARELAPPEQDDGELRLTEASPALMLE